MEFLMISLDRGLFYNHQGLRARGCLVATPGVGHCFVDNLFMVLLISM